MRNVDTFKLILLVLLLYCLETPADALVPLLFVVCTIGTYDLIDDRMMYTAQKRQQKL